jgi:hypothetical protein
MPLDLHRTTGLITEGVHLFKVTKAKEQLSQSSGNPQWVVEFTCQDAGDDQGRIVTVFMALEGSGRFVTDAFLDAIEAPRKGSMKVEDTLGKLVRLKIKTDSWNGANKSAVDSWLPAKAGPAAQTPPPTRTGTMTPAIHPATPEQPKGIPTDVAGNQKKPNL